ncbi:MAG: hypothetical protein NBV77_03155 [Bacteroidia bacterium]|nr:hypothetical protein [Bacteroidia bacterium]
MRNIFHTFSTILALASFSMLQAQSSEVVISGTRVVDSSETFSVKPGQTLIFEEGARLLVFGGLNIKGTQDNPTKIISRNAETPGLGIVIADNKSRNQDVIVENAEVSGLVQALRFDPFWYRKSVRINNVKFSGIDSREPLIYASSPLLDLRDNKSIDFQITNSRFFNNTGNVILEKVGSLGIKYTLDKLTFNDNTLKGDNASMGILHLDFARTVIADEVLLGDLTFVNNKAGDKNIGLSVSGGSGVPVNIPTGKVFSNASGTQVIFDNRRDPRLPKIGANETSSLKEKGGDEIFITGATHKFGRLALEVVGQPKIVEIKDSFGRAVFINQNLVGDSLIATYLEGNPVTLTLQNGLKYNVPQLTAAQLPPPLYRRVDTTLISPEWPDTTLKAKVGFMIIIPMFHNPKEIEKLKTWEFGFWGGGSIYGGGDIAYKGWPIPSTIEISGGGYAQYNLTNAFSLKSNIYRSTVSVHNLWAQGLLSGGKVPLVTDTAGNKIQPYPNSWPMMFVTPMTVLDVEGLWHIGKYSFKPGQKGKFVNSMGISLGVFTYTPYRIAYRNQKNDESDAAYKARLWSEERVNLRELGLEGQNFLENSKPYGKFSMNVGLSWQLAYIRKRWAFKGEAKAVYTFTDYLDDYGPGLWYGGDYDAWLQSVKDNPTYAQDPTFFANGDLNQPLAKLYKTSGGSTTHTVISPNAARSTNGVNDWYYQAHMGLSYRLQKKDEKPKIETLKEKESKKN